MKKDFISITELNQAELNAIFALTDKLKKNKHKFKDSLCNKTIALIFEKPSNRTRVSFEVGMNQLGGHSLYLGPDEISLGVRETIQDVAKTLSRYVQGIVLRTFSHENILEMAKYADIPVINGLTDLLHPCQALADLYTIKEKMGKLKGVNLVYIGDGNNVCHSLLHGAAITGMNLTVITPKNYEPSEDIVDEAISLAKKSGAKIAILNDPKIALNEVDIIYTDVWASMGQEKEAGQRKVIFKDYQVNKELVSLVKKNCLIMHCLPAHRGEEITDEVIDSKNSIVFDQAENRLHVQKAILIKLLNG